jgi:hypothetical protein
MIWLVRNSCLLDEVTDMNMKRPERRVETFDLCSISYSANLKAIFEFFSRTLQL